MERIKKTIEAAQKDIATKSTRSQSETLSKTGLPNTWVAAIFDRLQARYGHKWVSAVDGIEETAIREWSMRLAGLTGRQIKRGLDSWSSDWPPSSEEFRGACLGTKNGANEFGLDYVPAYYRPQPIREKAKLLSSDERDARRADAAERIKEMRAAIIKA